MSYTMTPPSLIKDPEKHAKYLALLQQMGIDPNQLEQALLPDPSVLDWHPSDRQTKEWDESSHPRDETGKFGSGGGGQPTSKISSETYSEKEFKAASKAALMAAGGSTAPSGAEAMKKQVAKDLAARLADNPDWQKLCETRAATHGDKPEDVSSLLVKAWAQSSGDSNPLPVALQLAAKQEFGLDDTKTDHLDWKPSEGGLSEAFTPDVLQAFVRAQYDSTQQYLSDKGITSVPAFRSVVFPEGSEGQQALAGLKGSETSVDLQPMSSFSASAGEAKNFGDHPKGWSDQSTVMYAQVPADRILSTPRTGFGCKQEAEIVVLGHADVPVKAYSWKGQGFPDSGPSLDAMQAMATSKSKQSINLREWTAAYFQQMAGTVVLEPQTKDWDEGQHPRDETGKFESGGGGGGGAKGSWNGSGQKVSQETFDKVQQNKGYITGWKDSTSTSYPREQKAATVARLANNLKDNPAWQKYIAETQGASDHLLPGETAEQNFRDKSQAEVSKLIGSWAVSSSDTNPTSIALQQAVQHEFGLDAPTNHFNQDVADQTSRLGSPHTDALQAFVRAQYNDTQQLLSQVNIKQVPAYRGVNLDTSDAPIPADGQEHQTSVDMQPASSFSLVSDTSWPFATGKWSDSAKPVAMVLGMTVPADRILSTPKSGFGCANETEMVVLGGKDIQANAIAWPINTPNVDKTPTPQALDQLVYTPSKSLHRLVDFQATLQAWKDWDESQHPRDETGKFGSGGGGGTGAAAKPKKLTAVNNKRLPIDEVRARIAKQNTVAGYDQFTQGKQPGEFKAEVAVNLAASLKGNPTWDTYVKEAGASGDLHPEAEYELALQDDQIAASRLVQSWAGTSGDSSSMAVALQLAAQREFGLDDAATSHFEDDVVSTADRYPQEYKDGYQTFLRGMYNQTQDKLSQAGIKELTLYRGVGIGYSSGFSPDSEVHSAKVDLQPVSSFTSNSETAETFANDQDTSGHAVLAANIPADRILSCPTTGLGCANEQEYTVLGASKVPTRSIAWRAYAPSPATDLLASSQTQEEAAASKKSFDLLF